MTDDELLNALRNKNTTLEQELVHWQGKVTQLQGDNVALWKLINNLADTNRNLSLVVGGS